ncbi:unnamed protein product (macronuclear) [Paramecium tetraurelia]|uniref:Uncharacterized protein n=1 Tax=Paramecium tetraurelia TaxID=5888 RepID=A0CJY0_PARTE|nr:uncharacterized protein GSPATT00000809001 [Paramecium tetraurelia]CAK71097.1 unnamed protein product [Paramecium tetraurelia]|eukprot:XP_001438494.1 hypothetical protein (macronuclear) [Paramecium tetraurelia strain d4-2]
MYQDKAILLTELQQLKQRNLKLEFELKELFQSYNTMRSKSSRDNIHQLEEELDDLKIQHQNMKDGFDYKLELLRIRLEKVNQENNQLTLENSQLIQQQSDQIQQTQSMIQMAKQSKALQNSQIVNFKNQVHKIKTVVEQKIVKKSNKLQMNVKN